MGRPRMLVILLSVAAAAVAVVRHGRGPARGHRVPGGILIGDAAVYDTLSRLLLGRFVGRVAADVAAAVVACQGSEHHGISRPQPAQSRAAAQEAPSAHEQRR